MSLVHKRGSASIQGNLTPMIDMTFLLIVFFVLVSRIVDVERAEMNLPQPKAAATERLGDEQRVVINVLPARAGEISGYRVGSKDFPAGAEGLSAMTEHLIGLYQANPTVSVNVRADRATHYEWVEPVLQAVSDATRSVHGNSGGAARVNLVVVQER